MCCIDPILLLSVIYSIVMVIQHCFPGWFCLQIYQFSYFCYVVTFVTLPYFRPVNPASSEASSNSPSLKRMSAAPESSTDSREPVPLGSSQKHASTGSLSLSLSPPQAEPLIVHAGAVISMLHLVPSIASKSHTQVGSFRK